jgi:hypothetical protein
MYSQIFYWTLVIHLQMRVLVLPKVVVSLGLVRFGDNPHVLGGIEPI